MSYFNHLNFAWQDCGAKAFWMWCRDSFKFRFEKAWKVEWMGNPFACHAFPCGKSRTHNPLILATADGPLRVSLLDHWNEGWEQELGDCAALRLRLELKLWLSSCSSCIEKKRKLSFRRRTRCSWHAKVKRNTGLWGRRRREFSTRCSRSSWQYTAFSGKGITFVFVFSSSCRWGYLYI